MTGPIATKGGAPDAGGSLHVAIVGSGPSGFYLAEALLKKAPEARVDMFDRLPTPFGLVRGGVAPDHPKIKQVTAVYERIAGDPRFSFAGNIEIGRDLAVAELRRAYHAVALACGADEDRRLGVPGEDLPGSYGAAEFVGWYNGHPDRRSLDVDLSGETAVVVGHGNVAADIARMLLTPVDRLKGTDVCEEALQALSESRIRRVLLIGRRGPVQARFTPGELKELSAIPGCRTAVDALALGPACEQELARKDADDARKNIELFRKLAVEDLGAADERRLDIRFLLSPIALLGEERVSGVRLARNRLFGEPGEQQAWSTGEEIEIQCDIVFRSVGYRARPLDGVDFDPARGVFSHASGRCALDGAPSAGLYVTGWAKRGPSGTIGVNRADSVETAETIVSDLGVLRKTQRDGRKALASTLKARGLRPTSWADWRKIDMVEQARGEALGKPRAKLRAIADMLAILDEDAAA